MVKSVAIALASILLSTTLVAQPQGQSEPKEISDLRKAAEQGDAQKQWDLGGRYYSGKGVAEDHSEALKWYSKAAEQGDPEKQFRVGFMYWLERNNVEAAKWYRKAAEQGVVLAQSDLGDMYRDGKGVPQNYVEAAKWYHRAAENETVEKNGLIPTQAFSQYSLGAQYESGLGVLQDYVEAAKWYRKAVESGDSMAVFSLYSLCLNGKSTKQDCADVAKWLSILANHDDSDLYPSVRATSGSNVSQYFLGTLYEKGLGVPQNYVEAAKWYRKAADQGRLPGTPLKVSDSRPS